MFKQPTNKHFWLLLVSLVFSLNAISQNEIWYFGSNFTNTAGLDFSSGSPVAHNGQNSNSMRFYESNTSFTDGSGNMLFYTDGIAVYDASNSIMPNLSLIHI